MPRVRRALAAAVRGCPLAIMGAPHLGGGGATPLTARELWLPGLDCLRDPTAARAPWCSLAAVLGF